MSKKDEYKIIYKTLVTKIFYLLKNASKMLIEVRHPTPKEHA